MSSNFENKIKELQRQIDAVSGGPTTSTPGTCFPTLTVIAVAIPIAVFLGLYFINPKLVQVKDGIKQVRSNTKVFLWTVVFTLILWAALYTYSYIRGHNGSSICNI
jgi:hypothetical protein